VRKVMDERAQRTGTPDLATQPPGLRVSRSEKQRVIHGRKIRVFDSVCKDHGAHLGLTFGGGGVGALRWLLAFDVVRVGDAQAQVVLKLYPSWVRCVCVCVYVCVCVCVCVWRWWWWWWWGCVSKQSFDLSEMVCQLINREHIHRICLSHSLYHRIAAIALQLAARAINTSIASVSLTLSTIALQPSHCSQPHAPSTDNTSIASASPTLSTIALQPSHCSRTRHQQTCTGSDRMSSSPSLMGCV
jgi:hypothetical protein